MAISAVSNGIELNTKAASGSDSSNLAVDSETFLTLLAAQLQYQDPLNPQTDTEFVTQLAQMSSLEQMQSLNSGVSAISAYALVGKYACAQVIDSATGETGYCCGAVDSVVSSGGSYYAVIGDTTVGVDSILQVFDTGAVETGSSLVNAGFLIGKTVTGSVQDETGTARSVTGTVTGVSMKDGAVCVAVDGTQILLDSITEISESL